MIRYRPPVRLDVLVVDDCPDTTTSLALLLDAWGHDVRVANDGSTALHALEEQRFDVVLLDIGMPGLDGHEVARQLRRLPDGNWPIVVILSGYASTEAQIRSSAAGCDLHLVKPIDPHLLQDLIHQFARRRGDLS